MKAVTESYLLSPPARSISDDGELTRNVASSLKRERA